MNMDFVWVRTRGMYIATVHDTRGAQSLDHHFEADPKILSADDIWLEWLKQIADFLKEHGQDVSKIQTKIADYNAVYYTGERIRDDNDIDTEQAGAVGNTDDRSRHGGTGSDSSADRGELSQSDGTPPPIAPSWPGAADSDDAGTAAADADAG
ncbi:MAG TPA: hypothetical protein VN734_17205 [Acidobacteriaceae bacterium]|nr:hypothetical protein [Acidobacteriaceae bacterium]